MFQYSTETIINSNVGNLPLGEGVRYAAVTMGANGMTAGGDAFIVDGVGLYHKANITAVYEHPYEAAVKEALELDLAVGVSAGDVVRLAVYTTQEGLSSSIYADAQLRHKKPFFYEITVGDPDKVAEELAKVIKAEMALTDFNFFKAVGTGADLALTADDCYTRFQVVRLDAPHTADNVNYTGWQDYETLLEWKRETAGAELTKGTEGAGTVARLIKNLRVPTDANTNPFGVDMGGRPVPGGKYDQITIEYTTDRRHIGGQVMGALDKSITTHTFFVPAKFTTEGAATTSDFLTELKKVYTGSVGHVGTYASDKSTIVAPATGSKQ